MENSFFDVTKRLRSPTFGHLYISYKSCTKAKLVPLYSSTILDGSCLLKGWLTLQPRGFRQCRAPTIYMVFLLKVSHYVQDSANVIFKRSWKQCPKMYFKKLLWYFGYIAWVTFRQEAILMSFSKSIANMSLKPHIKRSNENYCAIRFQVHTYL